MDQFLDSILGSINRLSRWIDHSYLGWDPYDALNSVRFNHFQKWPDFFKIAIIQMNKASPINFRSTLVIEPGIDTKGISIFLQGYCGLYDSGIPGPLGEDGPFLFSKLMEEKIENDNTISWSSHYFNYVNVKGSILTPDTPDLIGSSNVMKAICQYAEHKDLHIEHIIEKYYNYLIDNFDRDHGCFAYGHHIKNKYVPNLDAEVISSYHYTRRIVENDDIKKLCQVSLNKLIEYQNNDGSWYYSYYHDGGNRKQLDFHQGYVIDGLINSIDVYPNLENEILESIRKAVKSYDSIFSSDGRGYYRYPRQYPTDIHNQAQGIITYSNLYDLFEDRRFYEMSRIICKWTIENMQDADGHFYFQKGRLLANKIPYMRWSQAWMMLALSRILETERTIKP